MRHGGICWPNGAVEAGRILSLPATNLLMLISECRYHGKAAQQAGKRVALRALPRIGKRPAELGWSPARFVDEALDKTDEPGCGFDEFIPWNELDLAPERGDHADDYADQSNRYALIGGFAFSVLQQLRGRLPPGTRLHFPAFTPDHFAFGDFAPLWQPAADLADVVDWHAYDSLWNIQQAYLTMRRLFLTKPLALTEWHCKGDVEEERRVLTWLADTMAADPLFDAAYFYIWRWWDHPSWWSDAWDVEHSPDRYALFMDPPVAKEPPMPDFPIPVDDAGNEWAPSKQDIIDGAIAVADEVGLPRDLMLALCLAESGEGLQSFERWSAWTYDAQLCIANRDRAGLQTILDRIAGSSSNDISFGPCHQTWRWSPEYNGHSYDLQAILEMRKKYIQDHGYALRVARDQLASLWARYGPDKVETLSRYNKPDGLALGPVRARYAQMMTLAPSLLPAAPEQPPLPPSGDVRFEAFTDPQPAGTFVGTPRGVILHGSRSGKAGNPKATEYLGTARYEVNNTADLGWHATIGEGTVAVHLDPRQWGWNARGSSSHFLAVEFAQATVDEAISDAQVDAFCAWLTERVLPVWPALPMFFPTHAELDGTPEYGPKDGKTDVYPAGSPLADELRARIMARLGASEPEQPPAPPAPPPQPAYSVGSGILAAMAAYGDEPATDELYSGPNGSSEAYGASGSRYVWLATLGRCVRFDPAA
jgi:hypothetical protein